MGPGGIGTTRGLPTAGLKSLLSYYGGDGPCRDKLETFIRDYLVYDGAAVPDALIDLRYEASIDPEVVANPPLRRPSGPRRCARCGGWTSPATAGWPDLHDADPGDVGRDDKVNRPSGGPSCPDTMPNCDCTSPQHRPLGPVGARRPVQRLARLPERGSR